MSTARFMVAVSLVAAAGAIARTAREPTAEPSVVLDVPYTIAAWDGVDAGPLDAETERSIAADLVLNRTYVAPDGSAAGLYVAYYKQQRPGFSIHSPLHCLPGTGWDVLSNKGITVDRLKGERSGSIRRLVARKSSSTVLILYWYAIHGRMIGSDVLSRAQLLTDRVRLGRNDAALVRLVFPVVDSQAAAERRGLAFVRALVPYL